MGNSDTLPYSRQYGYHELSFSTVVKTYHLGSPEENKSFRNLVALYCKYDVPTILPIVASYPLSTPENPHGWRLEFKYLPHNLQMKIEQARVFEQEVILHVIDCVLSALMAFKLNKFTHGNINCENILLDDADEIEGGQGASRIYVIGLPLLLNNSDFHQLVSSKNYKKLYLSPQQIVDIQEGNIIRINEKQNVFSLGIVALRMLSLSSKKCENFLEKIYYFEGAQYGVSHKFIEKTIFQGRRLYSACFCDLIQKMLAKQDKERLDYEGVLMHFENISTQQVAKSPAKPSPAKQSPSTNQKPQKIKLSKTISPQNKIKVRSGLEQIQVTPSFSLTSEFRLHNSEVPKDALNSINRELFRGEGQKFYQVESSQLRSEIDFSVKARAAWEKFSNKMDKNIALF